MKAAFTEGARRLIVLAQEEAALLGHHHIGTGHLLLGLIQQGDEIAATALAELGLALEDVRGDVREDVHTDEGEPTGRVPFTPRARMALELALRRGLQRRLICINPHWILFGLFEEREGVAAHIFRRRGIELARVERILQQLSMNKVAHGLLRDRHHRARRYPSLCPRCATTPDEYASLHARPAGAESGPKGTWKIMYCGTCNRTLEIRLR